MKQGLLTEFSNGLVRVVKQTAPRLVHIGGKGIRYRTGIRLEDGLIVTTAYSAREGEEVPFLEAGNGSGTARVLAIDGTYGLVLLKTDGKSAGPGWDIAEPALGELAVTVAFPSPAGPEARIDAVRCVGEDYFQTDGAAFPGFAGAAIVSTEGRLLGMVRINAAGNEGQNLSAAGLMALTERLKTRGSRKRRVLGVRTQPVKEGLLVVEVVEGSAAEQAGLLVGDLIQKLNESPMEGPAGLHEALQNSEGEVALSLRRGGTALTVKAAPTEETDNPRGPWNRSHCRSR